MVWNIDAVRFLKPNGWKGEGGINWYPGAVHQASLEGRVTNPDGSERIEALPWCYRSRFTRPVVAMAEGTNYMGSVVLRLNEAPPRWRKS